LTIVKFAIPKGSIEESTFKILEKSWTRVVRRERTYRVMLDDPQISVKMLRPQEIPNLVFDGLYDVGITGRDWVKETNSDVKILLDLEFGKIKLVIAIPDSYNFKSLDDMILTYAKKKKILRISSEYLTTASKFIMQCKNYKKLYGSKQPLIVTPWLRLGSNKNIQIFLSFGATEAKPPEDVDAIMDVTETGTTLTQNQLRIIDTVMESTAVLIANKTSLKNKSKREKIFDIVTMLRGAVEGKKAPTLVLKCKRRKSKEIATGTTFT